MPICPHCKKDFVAKNIEKDLIQGAADGNNMLGKVTFGCPNCHYFLGIGDIAPDQIFG